MKLIKRLINISEKAVEQQAPTNAWSYEGICHSFAQTIVAETREQREAKLAEMIAEKKAEIAQEKAANAITKEGLTKAVSPQKIWCRRQGKVIDKSKFIY